VAGAKKYTRSEVIGTVLMKRPCPNLRLLLLISFCGLVLRCPSTLIGADETPIPAQAPAATTAPLTSTAAPIPSITAATDVSGGSPTASPTVPPSVRWVGVHTWKGEERNAKVVYAQRGDEIWVDIINFKDWVNHLEKKPTKHEWQDLVLYLDHIPFPGLAPFYSHERPEPYYTDASVPYYIRTVGFSLVRDDDSKVAWSHLLNQPVFHRKVIVSVGFPSGEEIPSELTPEVRDSHELDQQFYLTVIPKVRTALGFIVILAALIAFFGLARYTGIVRDAAALRRPDGQMPYSLARGQMAFWFFLVIAAYFFLWIVTGDMNTLNASVLGLIGISAGTALGSALVDAAKPASSGTSGNPPIVDVTRPHNEVLAELTKLRADTEQELGALQKARTLISPSDKQALDDNEQQQNEVRQRLTNYRWQSAYFGWPTWKGVMYDLLAENNVISFYRFQIFVWTLILGIMFIASVYNELAMPQFSATLLGLLGISGGTYVGFKLPETKAA